MADANDFQGSMLGKPAKAVSKYTPSLLYPIAREKLRSGLIIDPERLPFQGADLWTAYELSWLNRDGKPEVGVIQIRVPCSSRAIVESKSLKLYLASFSQTPFTSAYDVVRTLEADLSVTTGTQVVVDLLSISQALQAGVGTFAGDCLDTLKIHIDTYRPDPGLLESEEDPRPLSQSVYSNLLRSVCPVTGQPDIGSVQIVYSGARIDQASLLRYIVSFREYEAFHEQCVERMFLDILDRCRPKDLMVYARYLRRGGVDINPYRTTGRNNPDHIRLARQ